jgi:hypothetical protein
MEPEGSLSCSQELRDMQTIHTHKMRRNTQTATLWKDLNPVLLQYYPVNLFTYLVTHSEDTKHSIFQCHENEVCPKFTVWTDKPWRYKHFVWCAGHTTTKV